VCTHCALHEAIEVGTRPAHICFTGNGFASETQSIPLTTSQSTGWNVERSPEKAGVGGSIPSLATMFSSTYKTSKQRFGLNWSQNL
jgi:hypothetical protein